MKKKLLILAIALLSLFAPVGIKADSGKIIDNVGVINASSISSLEKNLSDVARRNGLDVYVYIVDFDGFSAEEAGKVFLDNISSKNCAVLAINTKERDCNILLHGECEELKGYIEEGLDWIYDNLHHDNYEGAIRDYASWLDSAYEHYSSKGSHSVSDKLETAIGAALGTGALGSLVTTLILKGQLKTEGKKHGAMDYANRHTFDVRRGGEIFMYRTVQRRPRASSSRGNGPSHSGTTRSGKSYSSGKGRHF